MDDEHTIMLSDFTHYLNEYKMNLLAKQGYLNYEKFRNILNKMDIPDSIKQFAYKVSSNQIKLEKESIIKIHQVLEPYKAQLDTMMKQVNIANDIFIDQLPGLTRDILISQNIFDIMKQGKMEIAKENIEKYDNLILNDFIKKQIKIAFQFKDSISKRSNDGVNLLTFSITGDSLYRKILRKHKGKIIYIDFWATWCKPCKLEMPFSKKLLEIFKSEELIMVFLCISSPESIWKETVNELRIRGDHYLLSKEQNIFFENKFGISTIPHYILIDNNGNIINDNAQYPSDPDLLNKITELIRKKEIY